MIKIALIITLFFSFLHAAELPDELLTYLNSCKEEQDNKTFTLPENLESSLDCLAKTEKLSRLGAQWLMLKRARWKIEFYDGPTAVKIKENPYSSVEFNRLLFNRETFISKIDSNQIYFELEQQIFPALLRKSFLALEASFYHYTALTSNLDPLRWYSKYTSDYSFQQLGKFNPINMSLVTSDPLRGRFWPELFNLYSSFTPCNSNCLAIMEGKLIRSSLLFLGHLDLASTVHHALNSNYGCEDAPSHFKHIGVDLHLLRKAQWGADALVGLPLYFKSINASLLDNESFIGMNGILRKISDNAVRDLVSIGGAGANAIGPNEIDSDGSIDDELNFLSGASAIVGQYWKLRSEGKMAEAEKLLERPFFLETWFEPTIAGLISLNMKDWVEKLYRKNPRTPYKFFAYRYFTPFYFNLLLGSINRLPTIKNQTEYSIKPAATYPDNYQHNVHYTAYEFFHGLSNLFIF
ncbi:MAG: hypothetical protein HN353_12570 [Bdellovibrionales bacterium]|jgi:hypothetical protein|nr:hypothetical protein [Bdellovibrionales bacterium]MBT3526350.1 hypothetical protein [Bdellovibrionales bacterium]MBT7668558.1 hypothetical protein [Bdellovibrionales bacterium]